MLKQKEKTSNTIWTIILSILSIAYVYPIVMIFF